MEHNFEHFHTFMSHVFVPDYTLQDHTGGKNSLSVFSGGAEERGQVLDEFGKLSQPEFEPRYCCNEESHIRVLGGPRLGLSHADPQAANR